MNEDISITILRLPEAIVAHILEWLKFSERRRYFSCSAELWTTCRETYESLLPKLVVFEPPPLITLQSMINLTTLNVSKWATDFFLRHLEHEQAVPLLKHLSLAQSMHVTDAGLESLTRNSIRCQTLESIDITYCRRTTYAGTFILRDELTNLKLIRRQPEWLDGMYETPFENDHLHTYWADGTFSFSRDSLNSGYVCDYFEWDDARVGTKVQYNDLTALNDMFPDGLNSHYRPGVSIKRLTGEKAILVAQLQRGIFQPKDYPILSQKDACPIGESIYLNENGVAIIQENDNAHDSRYVMISHIPMRPLESFMPPPELVKRNRAFLQDNPEPRVQSRFSIRPEEHLLHGMLGGRYEDFEAIQEYYEG
jgi:hypothetical protein